MDYVNLLLELINENNGIISSKMVTDAGIPRVYISKLVKCGVIRRLERGIYVSEREQHDEIFCFQMRFKQCVISHEYALYIHQYIKNRPKQIIATVKTGTNTKTLLKSGIRVHSICQDLYSLGIVEKENECGRIVCVYDIERSICDILRNRSRIENDVIISALKRYLNSPKKDLEKLFCFAKRMKVENVLNQYIKILQ